MNKLTQAQAEKLHSLIEKIRDRTYLEDSGISIGHLCEDLDDAVAEVTEEEPVEFTRDVLESRLGIRMPQYRDLL